MTRQACCPHKRGSRVIPPDCPGLRELLQAGWTIWGGGDTHQDGRIFIWRMVDPRTDRQYTFVGALERQRARA